MKNLIFALLIGTACNVAHAQTVRGACMSQELENLVQADPCAAAVAQSVVKKIISDLSEGGADLPDCVGFDSIKQTHVPGGYTVKAGSRDWEATTIMVERFCRVNHLQEVPSPINF